MAAETGLRVPADVSLPVWDDSQSCRPIHPVPSAAVPTPVPAPRGSTAPPSG